MKRACAAAAKTASRALGACFSAGATNKAQRADQKGDWNLRNLEPADKVDLFVIGNACRSEMKHHVGA